MNKIDFNDWFHYDESSRSCLRWKVDLYTGNPKRLLVKAGDEAGGITYGGDDPERKWSYYAVRVQRQGYRAHRVIYEMFNGKIPDGNHVDHIDGDTLNNRVANLRVVTAKKSSHNLKMFSTNKTGINGVRITCKDGRYGAVASWQTCEGKSKSKYFSFTKYGEAIAMLLATKARQDAILELNNLGADYTERHGINNEQTSY